MNELNAANVREMLLHVAKRVIESKPYLTEIDSAIGDGDHGIGMAGGMEKVCELLERETFEMKSPYAVFSAAGRAMLMSMGGASGVIFGSLYMGGAKGYDAPSMTAEDLAAFFRRSLNAIQARGGASVGDKTMVDALAPAVEAMEAASGQGLLAALEAAKAVAAQGVENTKTCIAKFGRAKSLGARALGHPDAGAASVAIIFGAMLEYAAVQK